MKFKLTVECIKVCDSNTPNKELHDSLLDLSDNYTISQGKSSRLSLHHLSALLVLISCKATTMKYK